MLLQSIRAERVLGAVAALPSISHQPPAKVCQEPQPASTALAEARGAARAGLPCACLAYIQTHLLCPLVKEADPGLTWYMDFHPFLGALATTHKPTSTIKRSLCEYIQLGITTQLDSAPSDTANKALLQQESFSGHGWSSPHNVHTFRN